MIENATAARCVYLCYDDIGEACIIEACRIGIVPAGVITFPWEKAAALSGATHLVQHAEQHGFTLHETDNVNSAECVDWLTEQKPDLVLIAGWPRLVQQHFVDVPRLGVFGMHPTLLPKHRGRAPIPWAIISGLAKTGVTLYQILDASADAGPIVGQQEIPIAPRETATTLYGKVLQAHVILVHDHLRALCDDTAPRSEQDETRASYWPRRKPSDGIIDWNSAATSVDTWIRALTHPYPGAFTWRGDERITIWSCQVDDRESSNEPGIVAEADDNGVTVACGRQSVRLQQVQLGDGPPLRGAEIQIALPPGTRLG